MPTNNPFKFLDVHTNKGAAHMLAGMAMGQGTPAQATLLTTGVFVDREVINIGDVTGPPIDDDEYEIVDVSTDSTVDILTFWNNTDREILQTAIDPADYDFQVGDYVAVNSEIAIVISKKINSATDEDIGFYRGVAGTSIAAHSTGTDPIAVREGTALTADTITVPMIGVTQALGLDALAAIIGAGADDEDDSERGPANYNGVVNDLTQMVQGQWRFINMDDVVGILVSKIGGVRVVDVAITSGNNDWETAATYRGANANANISMSLSLVPTAEEVAGEVIVIPCNFEPTGVTIYATTTATGLVVAFDGTVTLDRVNNLVLIEFGGLVDLAATDTVSITVHGNVDVADAAVIG